ncbi:hypothetical protein BDFB_003021, partial [Asbolus verrucosus]
ITTTSATNVWLKTNIKTIAKELGFWLNQRLIKVESGTRIDQLTTLSKVVVLVQNLKGLVIFFLLDGRWKWQQQRQLNLSKHEKNQGFTHFLTSIKLLQIPLTRIFGWKNPRLGKNLYDETDDDFDNELAYPRKYFSPSNLMGQML